MDSRAREPSGAFEIGDVVILIHATQAHPWTEKLVGQHGQVVEVVDKSVLVGGLMGGWPLWFNEKQLEIAKEEEAK